ncbi:hypothetical protein N9D08_01480 [bacterium]|nr:hypothetical protein [bacterium]
MRARARAEDDVGRNRGIRAKGSVAVARSTRDATRRDANPRRGRARAGSVMRFRRRRSRARGRG